MQARGVVVGARYCEDRFLGCRTGVSDAFCEARWEYASDIPWGMGAAPSQDYQDVPKLR